MEVDLDLPDERIEIAAHARGELLQIAREALSNTARHAHATTARVVLRRDADQLRMELMDDGMGFDSGATAPGGHLGLANMRDRASRLGGTLEVESGRGGTTIIVLIPMRGSTADRPTDQEEATW